jgi:hypothetical protein
MKEHVLDDSSLKIPYMSAVCCFCAHWQPKLARGCDAFPTFDGIPLEIWKGQTNHTTPFPGDHGIVFKERVPKK